MGLTKTEIKNTVDKVGSELDKLDLAGRWYVGGSAGLLLLGYPLEREINDIDIVICAPKYTNESGDMLEPHHYGCELHQAIVGPDWNYTKSGSHSRNGVRVIHGKRDGVSVDILIKHAEYPNDLLADIINEKGKLLRDKVHPERIDKHKEDLLELYRLYRIKSDYL